MLRELCLRSGVLVPPELMQSSSSLAGSASMQVLAAGILLLEPADSLAERHCAIRRMMCVSAEVVRSPTRQSDEADNVDRVYFGVQSPVMLSHLLMEAPQTTPLGPIPPDGTCLVPLQPNLSMEPPPLSRTPEPQEPATSQPARPLPPLPPPPPQALSAVSAAAAAPGPAASEATPVPQLVTGTTSGFAPSACVSISRLALHSMHLTCMEHIYSKCSIYQVSWPMYIFCCQMSTL